ncbi:MAG: PIN domain nuclease of toxin-antitoxin system [Akkermansiaceae bacterium]|jgi:PIN domain nuclease of toxin-antitoxin system
MNQLGRPRQIHLDRIIAATAQVHDLTIVTSDQVLLAASFLRTLSTRSLLLIFIQN